MKFIILTITSIFINSYLNAQCWNNVNTITTDWNNYPGNGGNNLSDNSWDWTTLNYNNLYITGKSNPIDWRSPFWAAGSGATNINTALFDFQKHNTANKKDFQPKDGWELLVKDFGTTGIGNTVSFPFFALYNKFTGKIRAFLLVPDKNLSNSNTGAMLRIHFPNVIFDEPSQRISGLFQHMQPVANVFEDLDILLNANIPNVYNNEDYYWLFSEFTVAYDPCTCMSYPGYNEDAKLNFQYYLIEESEINAKITGTITEKVMDNSKPVSADPVYSLSKFKTTAKGIYEVGQKGYKEYSGYAAAFNKFLRQNSDSNQINQLFNEYKRIRASYNPNDAEWSNVFLGGRHTDNEINYNNFKNGDLIINPTALLELEKENFFTRYNSQLKGIASLLPYVGTAIGVVNFLSSAKNDTEKSVVIQGPTVFEANLKLEGSIKKLTPQTAKTIFLPGFNASNNNSFIPSYNNILGVFNILELPKFQYYEINPNNITNITKDALNPSLSNFCKSNYSNLNINDAQNVKFRQYFPLTDVKYTVNPASDLEIDFIEAAVIFKYYGGDKLFIDGPSDFNNLKAIPLYPKITLKDEKDKIFKWGYFEGFTPVIPKIQFLGNSPIAAGLYFNKNGKLINSNASHIENLKPIFDNSKPAAHLDRIESITNNTNLKLDFISNNFAVVDSSFMQLRTQYVPLTCFNKLNFILLGNNNIGDISLKLFVKLKHKTNPNYRPVTFILTYNLKKSIVDATINKQLTGTYDSKIWGKNWSEDNECCYKCGPDFDFKSANISNYIYNDEFNNIITPLDKEYFKTHNQLYAGQQFLNVVGDLFIPNNSQIPNNSIIQVKGIITFGENITINSNSKIYSENPIVLTASNTIQNDVVIEQVSTNTIFNNCNNYDFSNLKLTDNEILNFCNSTKYKNKMLQSPNHISSKDSLNLVEKLLTKFKLNFLIQPNPSNDEVSIKLESSTNGLNSISITDILGKLIYKNSLLVKEQIGVLTISTLDFSNGVYFVTIFNGQQKVTKKLLVQHN